MDKTVIFGAAGQLGQTLQRITVERSIPDTAFLTRDNADILNLAALRRTFNEYKPAYCINCAAYTAVDKAEDEPEEARRINRDGVINLSQVCREYGSTFIHLSTDFVFPGTGNLPLS